MKKKILLMFLSMTIISAFSAYNIISAYGNVQLWFGNI